MVNQLLKGVDNFFESTWLKWLLLLLFSGILAWLKWSHVFERDESQVLLIALENSRFVDLVSTFGYEGTTGLWHIFLWGLSFVIDLTPWNVSVIHFFLIVIFIYFLVFKIEVPMIFKIMFLLQQSILWNFVFVRQYILGLIFIAIIVYALIHHRDRLFFIFLFLLMQVHLICVPIAISFWFYFLSIQLHNHKSNFSKFNFIPIVGLILVVYQLFPPNDLVEGLKTWNTNISFYGLTLKLRTLLLDTFSVGTSLVFIIFTPLMIYVQAKDLWKCNNKQVFIVIASFLVVFFSYFLISVLKYLGFNHFSFLFYTLLAYAAIMFGLSMRKFNIRWYFLLIPILLILIYQAKVKINDYHLYPFSNANKVADFLDKNYDSSPVLIVPEPFMNSVVLYDNDNTVYYSLFRHKCCKYVIWNHPSVDHLRRKILPIDLNELKTAMFTVPDSILMNSPVLVVGGDRSSLIVDRNQVVVNGDIVINDTIMLKMICKFDQPKANWLTEIFWLYEVVVKK